MKSPLADFVQEVQLRHGVPNLIRGLISIVAAIFLLYLINSSTTEALQFDRDGIIDSGIVSSVSTHSSRRRRGRISTTYSAIVRSRYGQLEIPIDDKVGKGSEIRFIYSPTLESAILAPMPLKRGDMLFHKLLSWDTVLFGIVSLGMLWYAYHQFRLVYIVVSGRYTVNGKPPNPKAG